MNSITFLSPFKKRISKLTPIFISLAVSTLNADTKDRGSIAIKSPDGKYESVLHTTTDYWYYFQIYPSGQKEKFIKTSKFVRGVDMIWGPDHTRLALTHYGGSNFAYPLVYEISPDGKLENLIPEDKQKASYQEADDNLSRLFWRQFAQNYRTSKIGFGHDYVYAKAWLDKDTLLLGGRAYGNQGANLAVDSCWCLMYSLKDKIMSSKLKTFNRHTKFLPERDIPPHEGVTRGNEDIPVFEENGRFRLVLPQEDGGQTLTGEGKAGIIHSTRYYDGNTSTWKSDHLILNVFQEKRGYCRLLNRIDQKFSEKSSRELSDDFIKAAGWNLPKDSASRIYALAALDESRFILQGYAVDSSGKQIAWKTLLFDAAQKTFSENLIDYNDSRVKMYTIHSQREADK